jgi:hypothetical protein
VTESPASERDNALGDLAAVPAPEWEQRAASRQGPQPSELEQTSQLAEVGGLDELRAQSSPLTQALASVGSYIAKIGKDISTDSAALKRDKAEEAPVHQVQITKSGLQDVLEAPVRTPAITAQTSGADRQRIIDEAERQKIRAAAQHLKKIPEAKVASKDGFKAASDSVAADLNAAEEAIDSLDAFTGQLPGSPAEYQTPGKAAARAAPSPSTPSTSTSMMSSADSRADDDAKWKPSDFDGPDPVADRQKVQAQSLRREQQRALEQQMNDGTRPELTEEKKSWSLHAKEALNHEAFRQHEQRQAAEDNVHERHLAHELAEDKKAERIAEKRKQMMNEIERVEAHMQNKASKRWEDIQEARKRAIIKDSELLAQRRWAKSVEDEKAKEALWQKDQQMEKYMLPSDKQAHSFGVQDVRTKWEQEELQGIAKLEEARQEAERSMMKSIAFGKEQEEKEAKKEEEVMAEKLAERKKRLHTEAQEHKEIAAWKASIREKRQARLHKADAAQKLDKAHAEKRLEAIREEAKKTSAALRAEEKRDVARGKKAVAKADRAAQLQAAQQKKMVKEEETYREEALLAIAHEEKDDLVKNAAKVRLEERAREQLIKARNEEDARAAREHEQELREAEMRRRQEFALERKHAEERQEQRARERELTAVKHEEELKKQRAARALAREKLAAQLHAEALAHTRKEAALHLAVDTEEANHEIKLAQQHSAAAAAQLRARGVLVGASGAAPISMSLSGLIAKTAAHGAPKALATKLASALRTQVFAGKGVLLRKGKAVAAAALGTLGEDVGTVMIAQQKDTLKDEKLQGEAKRKAAEADEKVQRFAAEEHAKELARHKRWEEEAEQERAHILHESHLKRERHEEQIRSAHEKQHSQNEALRAVETRAKAQLKQLEAQRAALLGSGSGQDATLMNQGARMTSLFEGKEKADKLRKEFHASRKEVMVNKGALRLAQSQLDHLKARAESGELSQTAARDEIEAHKKAMVMLKSRVTAAEEKSRRLEHELFVAGQAAV